MHIQSNLLHRGEKNCTHELLLNKQNVDKLFKVLFFPFTVLLVFTVDKSVQKNPRTFIRSASSRYTAFPWFYFKDIKKARACACTHANKHTAPFSLQTGKLGTWKYLQPRSPTQNAFFVEVLGFQCLRVQNGNLLMPHYNTLL